jgi:hypothetical protein
MGDIGEIVAIGVTFAFALGFILGRVTGGKADG